jgi:hypothetical protein
MNVAVLVVLIATHAASALAVRLACRADRRDSVGRGTLGTVDTRHRRSEAALVEPSPVCQCQSDGSEALDSSINSMQNQLSRTVVLGHHGHVIDRSGLLRVAIELGHSVSARPRAIVLFDNVEEPGHGIMVRRGEAVAVGT